MHRLLRGERIARRRVDGKLLLRRRLRRINGQPGRRRSVLLRLEGNGRWRREEVRVAVRGKGGSRLTEWGKLPRQTWERLLAQRDSGGNWSMERGSRHKFIDANLIL